MFKLASSKRSVEFLDCVSSSQKNSILPFPICSHREKNEIFSNKLHEIKYFIRILESTQLFVIDTWTSNVAYRCLATKHLSLLILSRKHLKWILSVGTSPFRRKWFVSLFFQKMSLYSYLLYQCHIRNWGWNKWININQTFIFNKSDGIVSFRVNEIPIILRSKWFIFLLAKEWFNEFHLI